MTTLALVEAPTAAEVALLELEDLRAELAQPLKLPQAMSTVKRCAALKEWARVARLGADVSFQAGELYVRATRETGLLLLELTNEAGVTTYHHPGGPRTQPFTTLPKGTLAEYGLTPKLSSESQSIAKLPDREFELRLEGLRQAGRAPSLLPFLRAAARFRAPKRRRVTPTLTVLRRALLAMKEVRTLATAAEIATMRQIARISDVWMLKIEEQDARQRGPRRVDPSEVQRLTACILCGRTQPTTRPPVCPNCGGAWLTA